VQRTPFGGSPGEVLNLARDLSDQLIAVQVRAATGRKGSPRPIEQRRWTLLTSSSSAEVCLILPLGDNCQSEWRTVR